MRNCYLRLANLEVVNFAGADLTTTYGLCFNMKDTPQRVAERLHDARGIDQAILPQHVAVAG